MSLLLIFIVAQRENRWTQTHVCRRHRHVPPLNKLLSQKLGTHERCFTNNSVACSDFAIASQVIFNSPRNPHSLFQSPMKIALMQLGELSVPTVFHCPHLNSLVYGNPINFGVLYYRNARIPRAHVNLDGKNGRLTSYLRENRARRGPRTDPWGAPHEISRSKRGYY